MSVSQNNVSYVTKQVLVCNEESFRWSIHHALFRLLNGDQSVENTVTK